LTSFQSQRTTAVEEIGDYVDDNEQDLGDLEEIIPTLYSSILPESEEESLDLRNGIPTLSPSTVVYSENEQDDPIIYFPFSNQNDDENELEGLPIINFDDSRISNSLREFLRNQENTDFDSLREQFQDGIEENNNKRQTRIDYNLPVDFIKQEPREPIERNQSWYTTDDKACNICLNDNFEDEIITYTRCGHNICNTCMVSLREKTNNCPTCRKAFLYGDM
jgi:hypothetical protein